ncbi:MAG: Rpn family recombination-promoting nuclease/putative transposase [Thermoflexibacteraceae bacterium]
MPDKYINPFTDFGFKKIFGEEENKDLLIDFIQTLLPEKSNITTINYLKTEKLGRAITERKAIFDLYCENDKGEKFIVELQRAEQEYFKERSIYYSTFAIQEQAKKGNGATIRWDYNWQGVYTIAIMDFSFTQSLHKNVKTQVVLYDEENKMIFSDKLKFIYLEMEKFNKNIDELTTHYEKWLFLLKNLHLLDKIPNELREKAFQKVFNVAEIAKYKPQDRQKYEDSLKHYRDMENSLEVQYKAGAKDTKKEVALKAIAKGFDNDTITDLTGLDIAQIEKLRTEDKYKK